MPKVKTKNQTLLERAKQAIGDYCSDSSVPLRTTADGLLELEEEVRDRISAIDSDMQSQRCLEEARSRD